MKALYLVSLLSSLAATAAHADSYDEMVETEWQKKARFFGGVRGGVAVPDGGRGVAPTMGIELGVSVPKGVGFGLHILTMSNTPGIPSMGIKETAWAVGAMADLRMYFQTVRPLSLYGTLAAGFMGGPARDNGRNEVLPMVNPGYGARVKMGNTYTAFEFGLAGFQVPFISMSIGYEPDRMPSSAPYTPEKATPQASP